MLEKLSRLRDSEFSIFGDRPDRVVVGAGLWQLAAQHSIADVEGRLQKVRKTSENLFENVLFQLQAKSLSYDHGLYGGSDIDRLNRLAKNVFRNSSKIRIFDSHLKIFDLYADVCSRMGSILQKLHFGQKLFG
jgi:hypothetical protein